MKKFIFLIVLFVLFVGFFSFLFLPQTSHAELTFSPPTWKGLVPCGRHEGTADETAPCTLCHLIVLVQRVVQFILSAILGIAFVGIFISGIIYMISSGSEKLMTTAKAALRASLIGFSIALCAWLLVNTVMWLLATKPKNYTGPEPHGTGYLGIGIENWYTFNCLPSDGTSQSSAHKGCSAGKCITIPGTGTDTCTSDQTCQFLP